MAWHQGWKNMNDKNFNYWGSPLLVIIYVKQPTQHTPMLAFRPTSEGTEQSSTCNE